MDREISKLKTCYIDPTILDAHYRFTYENSKSDRINFYLQKLQFVISTERIDLKMSAITSVNINPLSKIQAHGHLMLIALDRVIFPFFVDTTTDGWSDLEAVSRQTRRWVISNQRNKEGEL